jgi:hypothetical protein
MRREIFNANVRSLEIFFSTSAIISLSNCFAVNSKSLGSVSAIEFDIIVVVDDDDDDVVVVAVVCEVDWFSLMIVCDVVDVVDVICNVREVVAVCDVVDSACDCIIDCVDVVCDASCMIDDKDEFELSTAFLFCDNL